MQSLGVQIKQKGNKCVSNDAPKILVLLPCRLSQNKGLLSCRTEIGGPEMWHQEPSRAKTRCTRRHQGPLQSVRAPPNPPPQLRSSGLPFLEDFNSDPIKDPFTCFFSNAQPLVLAKHDSSGRSTNFLPYGACSGPW